MEVRTVYVVVSKCYCRALIMIFVVSSKTVKAAGKKVMLQSPSRGIIALFLSR